MHLGDYKRVSQLLVDPRFRSILENEISCSTKPMSADDVEFIVGFVLARIVNVSMPNVIIPPMPPRLNDIVDKAGSAFWSGLGFDATQMKVAKYSKSFSLVAMSLLCYFARHSMEVVSIAESDSFAKLEATIPSNWLTFNGKVRIAVQSQLALTVICAETEFPGQFTDWGRGAGILNALFDFVEAKSTQFLSTNP